MFIFYTEQECQTKDFFFSEGASLIQMQGMKVVQSQITHRQTLQYLLLKHQIFGTEPYMHNSDLS